MSSIHTLVLKMTYTPNVFDALRLKNDPRYGRPMPWLVNRQVFLEDARTEIRPPASTPWERRERAKGLFYDVYESSCPVHGHTLFHTKSGKCAACRKPAAGPRGVARTFGAAIYQDDCALHGVTDFNTERGLCLSCFNTLGKPRPISTNPVGFYVASDGQIHPSPGA